MNLLPQYQKDIIYKTILTRFFFVAFFVISFWTFVFLILLYNVALYFNFQTPSIENRLARERVTQKANIVEVVENDIKELNDVLVQIDKIRSKESFNFPYILRVIGRAVPDGANLKNITFRNGEITISGHANERAQVLELKAALEEEKNFKNFKSPLSNIVKEKDINFTFSFSF